MGSTALQIITEAYRAHNLSEVTTFSTSLEFPYRIAKDILNDVIRQLNRQGNYWFTETKTALTYGVGTYQYSFNTLAVDPKRVIRVRKELADHYGDLNQVNWETFQRLYRSSATQTTEPTAWSKYGDTLELNNIPDQSYTLYVYHFKDMPKVTATSDTFLVPEQDEDILIDCCFQMLGYKLGKWDLGTAIQAMRLRIEPLLADMKQDAGLPLQMPAAF